MKAEAELKKSVAYKKACIWDQLQNYYQGRSYWACIFADTKHQSP